MALWISIVPLGVFGKQSGNATSNPKSIRHTKLTACLPLGLKHYREWLAEVILLSPSNPHRYYRLLGDPLSLLRFWKPKLQAILDGKLQKMWATLAHKEWSAFSCMAPPRMASTMYLHSVGWPAFNKLCNPFWWHVQIGQSNVTHSLRDVTPTLRHAAVNDPSFFCCLPFEPITMVQVGFLTYKLNPALIGLSDPSEYGS